jgi:hypothetical protein
MGEGDRAIASVDGNNNSQHLIPKARNTLLVQRKVAAKNKKKASGALSGSGTRNVKSKSKCSLMSTKVNDVTVAVDPFVEKTVAFPCNSPVVQELISDLGEQLTTDAICYHLKNSAGTVLRKNRGIGSRSKEGFEKYDCCGNSLA